MGDLSIDQANLVMALKLGFIDWFEYLERWRKLYDED